MYVYMKILCPLLNAGVFCLLTRTTLQVVEVFFSYLAIANYVQGDQFSANFGKIMERKMETVRHGETKQNNLQG